MRCMSSLGRRRMRPRQSKEPVPSCARSRQLRRAAAYQSGYAHVKVATSASGGRCALSVQQPAGRTRDHAIGSSWRLVGPGMAMLTAHGTGDGRPRPNRAVYRWLPTAQACPSSGHAAPHYGTTARGEMMTAIRQQLARGGTGTCSRPRNRNVCGSCAIAIGQTALDSRPVSWHIWTLCAGFTRRVGSGRIRPGRRLGRRLACTTGGQDPAVKAGLDMYCMHLYGTKDVFCVVGGAAPQAWTRSGLFDGLAQS